TLIGLADRAIEHDRRTFGRCDHRRARNARGGLLTGDDDGRLLADRRQSERQQGREDADHGAERTVHRRQTLLGPSPARPLERLNPVWCCGMTWVSARIMPRSSATMACATEASCVADRRPGRAPASDATSKCARMKTLSRSNGSAAT